MNGPFANNEIGSFEIGVSPIGRIPNFDWWQTVISQYANSTRFITLLENFNSYIDQTVNLDNFFDLMWNIDTAVGYGLDCWGRIVGVSRTLTVDAGIYFGFEEELPGSNPWNQEPFYAGPPSTSNYLLSDDAYRQLILAKAAFNICDGSIPAINQLLLMLFPNRGNAYVVEGDGTTPSYFGFEEPIDPSLQGWNNAVFYNGESFHLMQMQYVFKFALTPVELAIVQQSGVLPTPCGVSATIIVSP